MASTVIAGKPSNTVGEKDSTLILRGSSVKIQWGNKFIDLIKNGKINCEAGKILKTASSADTIKDDGIYLVGDQIWINIGGVKTQLSGGAEGSENQYVSFLAEQPDITVEQKNKALHNIGFYYNTLEEAENANITAGIIYVQEDNKLYVINQHQIVEYNQFMAQNNTTIEDTVLSLYIQNNSLMFEGNPCITFENSKITLNHEIQLSNGISSLDSSGGRGYKLYSQDGISYLEVDTIIERKPVKINDYNTAITQVSTALTVIKSTNENGTISIYFNKEFAPKNGDVLYVIGTVNINHSFSEEEKTLYVTINKKLNYDISFSLEIGSNTSIKTIPSNTDTITITSDQLLDGYKITFDPFIEVFSYVINSVTTDSESKYTICTFQNGDNFLLNNINTIYDTLILPDDSIFNTFVPNIEWVKQLLGKSAISMSQGKQLFDSSFPIGSIMLFNNNINDIPTGWVKCDGTNNTPDLSEMFILQETSEKGVIYIMKVTNFVDIL